MQIIIKYEASWRNSFLDGSNNEPLPKGGRNFVAASSNLNDRNKPESYKKREVTKQTVLGLLCRLIGEQRKLYQSQKSDSYYFKNIEERISFEDSPLVSNEIAYIRNMTGSFDRESYIGTINTDHWLFKSEFSNELWNLLFIEPKHLVDFIASREDFLVQRNLDPRDIVERVNNFKRISLSKLAEVNLEEDGLLDAIEILKDNNLNAKLKELFPNMKKCFSDIHYIRDEKVNLRALYCSALYLKLLRLNEQGVKVENNIKGFSVAGITPKDFMSSFTQGKKMVYGNPYLKKEKIKGEGEVISVLTKASGTLEIEINIPKEKALQLQEMIEAAGVSSFYLGKKGLAYVEEIII